MNDAARSAPLTIKLRSVERGDLPVLFAQHSDPDSNQLAGTKPRSREAFQVIWEKILGDPAIIADVIVNDALGVVGGISRFRQDGVDLVGYWVAREHWGRRIASQALAQFLERMPVRPLHATAARANVASIRVLEKCGFLLTGYHMGEETDRYLACELASFVLS